LPGEASRAPVYLDLAWWTGGLCHLGKGLVDPREVEVIQVIERLDASAPPLDAGAGPAAPIAARRPPPLVSIGLPVRNGERHLERAARSILDQDLDDLELIIVDNASTDGTEQIARRLAASDARVRYLRQVEDVGASANYCTCFLLARGRFFKWAAHDDWLEPGFLRACIDVLEREPDTVLVFPRTNIRDESGRLVSTFGYPDGFVSDRRIERFVHTLWSFRCAAALFGVTRTEVLERTHLIQAYTSADRITMTEIALQGPIRQLEPFLFNSTESQARQGRDRTWWTAEGTTGAVCDRWRLLGDYMRIVRATPRIGVLERLAMLFTVLGFFCRGWPRRALYREARSVVRVRLSDLWRDVPEPDVGRSVS
jgi:hypothetical protein